MICLLIILQSITAEVFFFKSFLFHMFSTWKLKISEGENEVLEERTDYIIVVVLLLIFS